MRPFPDHIWEDKTFQLFLKKKNLRKSTAKRYSSVLNSFCTSINKTPTGIHDLHKADLDSNVPEYRMWLSDALDCYVSSLIDSGKSKSTIRANSEY
jgi:hypothetical protein